MVDVDAVWSALAHPARRRIGPAAGGTCADCQLAELLAGGDDTSRFTTQRHLEVLGEASLVLVDESGRERRNFLNAAALYQATIGWLDPPSRHVAHVVDALRRGVESATNPTIQEEQMPECPVQHQAAGRHRRGA
ncbi:MAG: ArsR family transcriptional regulator [Actinomycetota bacterium]|nr:ArsR family transcriptional regulator [Actinomycetota bacterium]